MCGVCLSCHTFLQIPGPLRVCLVIKKKLTLKTNGVQNAAACLYDKMIYRNIPKIKSCTPGEMVYPQQHGTSMENT